VLAQIASPQNKGLFRKAIVQSGLFAPAYPMTFGPDRRATLADGEKLGSQFFDFCGFKSLEQARRMPAKRLKAKIEAFNEKVGTWAPWNTVADGKFIMDNPYTVIAEGKGQNVPILLGNTVDEFFAEPVAKTMDDLKEVAKTMFGGKADDFVRLLADASGSTLASTLHAMKNAGRVNGIEFAVRQLAKKFAENGVKQPLYYYQFGPEIPGWDHAGCFHSCDIWFFFETLAKSWRPWKGKHYELARQMSNYWAEFIRKGEPNGPDADGTLMPEWKPFTTACPNTMCFGDAPVPQVKEPAPVLKFILDNKK
jgi:para-nitrobenzyl esterase